MTRERSRLLEAALVGICACLNLAFAGWVVLARPELNPDFRGIWFFAQFARRHAAQMYQAAPLLAFQQHVYPGFRSYFPFQYPPGFLLATLWMGHCSYAAAAAIWTLAGLAALGVAAAMFFKPGCRGFAMLALAASPAALLNGAAGETGYFTTALLLAGFAMLPARPGIGGIFLGLLTLKPQLGILIPVALLAHADFRALGAAGLTALVLIALSCAIFPAGLWLDWLHCLPRYQAEYLAGGRGLNNAVTIAGNVIALGGSPGLAYSLQGLAGFGAIAFVFIAFRYASFRVAVAALLAGMFLCTPHAYAYDTMPLTAAMLLLAPASIAGRLGCAAVYLAPYLLLTQASGWFLYAIPETLLFIGIIYLAIGPGQRPNIFHESVPSAEPCPNQF